MNAPAKLFIFCSIIISLSCRAGDKPDQSAATKSQTHFTSFAQALAEAKRVVNTDPGKAYDVSLHSGSVPLSNFRNKVRQLLIRRNPRTRSILMHDSYLP
jgi:hypothetical protein